MISPTPEEIRGTRRKAGLSQSAAADLIYSTRRTWQDWEADIAKMHPGLWELFQLKQVLSFAQRQPAGWFVQGENTYLYTNTPEKPNFACINGGDKVVSIEPRYA